MHAPEKTSKLVQVNLIRKKQNTQVHTKIIKDVTEVPVNSITPSSLRRNKAYVFFLKLRFFLNNFRSSFIDPIQFIHTVIRLK